MPRAFPSLSRVSFWPEILGVLVLASTAAVLPVPVRAAEEAAPAATELEQMVRQWLNVRRQLNRTQNDWESERKLLEDEVRMLERRRQLLEADLEKQLQANRRLAEATAAAEASEEEARTAIVASAPALTRAEDRIRTWRARLPAILRKQVAAEMDALPPDATASPGALELPDRLQAVMAAYNQLQQTARALHAGKTVLETPEGIRQEMDVLMFGIAMGFAVSADDTRSAAGRPGIDGWEWQWDDSLAPAVRRALAVYRRELTPTFVLLPLQVEVDTEGERP